jgi:hypothetical protein
LLHSATQFHPFSTLPWDDQYPLHHRAIDQSLGSRLAGTVTLETGDSLTSLSYAFDGGTAMPIAFNATTGAFGQGLDLTKSA